MRTVYGRLFRIQIRHDWYPDGITRDDVAVAPTASTATLLDDLGLRTRTYRDGVVVFGEVEPGGPPQTLKRSVGVSSLRFAFELRVSNRALLNITDLPAYVPARTVFCFDNLREDVAGGRKILGDSIAGARVGAAVTLVSKPSYVFTLGATSVTSTITVRDRFGAAVATVTAQSPDASTAIATYAIDLTALGLVPGRYAVADDHGGSAQIYYDPGIAASHPWGIVEIFNRTEALTPDGTNRVPATYRFVNGDVLTALDPYCLQLEPLATTWRYVVTKKYANTEIKLGQLEILGPITFTSAVSTDTALFTSTAAVRLSSLSRGLTLHQTPPQPQDVLALPDPGLGTPLSVAPPASGFVSDMFVYV